MLTGLGSAPPKLTSPYWLPIKSRTDFNVLLSTYKFRARPLALKPLKAAYLPNTALDSWSSNPQLPP